MTTIKSKLFLLFAIGLFFVSCDDDDAITVIPEVEEEVVPEPDPEPPVELTTFDITITNQINVVGIHNYNSPQNLSSERSNPNRLSLDSPGEFFETSFRAAPGAGPAAAARLNFVSMSSITNDWLFAPVGRGVDIFDANGNPITGNITDQVYLWDAGTEEEDDATRGGGSPDTRQDDDNPNVRVITTDVSDMIDVVLDYDGATQLFTLTITNLVGEFGTNPVRVSPGLISLHAQADPFFTEGQPVRGNGLQLLAERGNIDEIWGYFNEVGSQGNPLRLSTAWSTISPGLVYAFEGSDPWFTQGDVINPASGLEELAEAGEPDVAVEYLTSLGLEAVRSEQDENLAPGESLTFTITVENSDDLRLGIGTMLTRTNDWYMSFNNSGIPLFINGAPFSGTEESDEIYLFDAGTEADEFIGIGDNLGNGTESGPADPNTTIRRVGTIEDMQFGKGTFNSGPGVVWSSDERGGYGIIEINVQPR